MAEGVLVDLNDYNCVQEPFNPNIIDAVSLIEEEYNVDGTIDHLVDGKRENNTCHSNNSGINNIDMSRKRSSLKRRPPVNTRPNSFELKSKAETTDLLTSSEPLNEMGCLNTELQAGELTDESLKSRNCDSSNDVSVIRRDHRTSRVSRNSAGASGGVFVNTYKQGFDGFTEEIVSGTGNLFAHFCRTIILFKHAQCVMQTLKYLANMSENGQIKLRISSRRIP